MARLGDRLQQHAQNAGEPSFDPFAREKNTYAEIPLEAIRPDPHQPRKDLGDLTELQASIATHGIVQPLVVSSTGYNAYLLIAGERRYTAARALGLKTVPAIVRSLEEHTRLEVQLIENIHRKDLNPLEEAQSYRRLMEEFGLTQEELGKRLGKAQPTINLTLKLLELPQEIQTEYLTSNNASENMRPISKSVLQEIARQPSAETQKALWKQARKGDLTVKKARLHLEASVQKTNKSEMSAQSSPARAEAIDKNPNSYCIQTQSALVTVSFEKEMTHPAEIIAALKQALRLEQERQETTRFEKG